MEDPSDALRPAPCFSSISRGHAPPPSLGHTARAARVEDTLGVCPVFLEVRVGELVVTPTGQNLTTRGFPGGTVVENLPANAGDTGSSPGLGRSHMPRSN